MAESWSGTRARLRESGVPDAAVVLPDDGGATPWEGALHAAAGSDGGWTLGTVDYGRARRLLRRTGEAELISALEAYVLTPLPPVTELSAEERERMLTWAAPHILDLVNRAQGGLVVDLPAGLLVDRIGALDGYLLFPTGTSFEARSLPPTTLDQPMHSFVTTAAFRVEALVTPPWFGRPGGGLRFSISEPGVGIRDLVREGRLARLA